MNNYDYLVRAFDEATARIKGHADRLDAGSATCTSRYRELAHENMALAERLAKVETLAEETAKRMYVAELDIKELSHREAPPLADGVDSCGNGTCVDRAGHEGPCTPRREAKVASAEGRPVCKPWCGEKHHEEDCPARAAAKDAHAWEPVCAHDVSLKAPCLACSEEVRECYQECCEDGRPLNPAQSREEAKDAYDDVREAERARVNGWWRWYFQGEWTGAKDDERDAGIASGAQPPGGGK